MQTYFIIYRLKRERQMHTGIRDALTPQDAAAAVPPGGKVKLIATAAEIRKAIAGAAGEDAAVFACKDKTGATWLAQVNTTKEQWTVLGEKGARVQFALLVRALRHFSKR